MAVAEKPAAKSSSQNATQQLALASFAGAAYIVAGLCLVLSGVPTLWDYWLGINEFINNDFLSTALVMLVSVAVGVGLVAGWRRLEGPHPLRGQRAGSFIGAALILLIFVIVFDWIGGRLAYTFDNPQDFIIPWSVILLLTGGLLVGVYLLYTRPGFGKFLVRTEDGGWFSTNAFKYNQGQRVRRATLIALLVVVALGLWQNLRTGLFARGNWEILLPNTDVALVGLFNVNYTLPFLIFCLCGWLAWRVVNWPGFADFLIATEAEMNKVSWTTRKRLIQDTLVVLVTLFLMTVFLFVVDIIWIRVLSFEPLGVLQINPQTAKQKQQVTSDW